MSDDGGDCDVMSTTVNLSEDSSQEEPMSSTRATPTVLRKRKSSEVGEYYIIECSDYLH